ncbi:hypothetical protein LQZ19_00655 [Treponema primitia]|uniref:hypothetical protein n=1 Tax=Treponema primitia TaxID=88058 RepID=UPI00397EE755
MNNYCTPDEKYDRGFINGYRIGKTSVSREILINIIKKMGKPSGKIIQKIKFETDLSFLDLMIFYALEQGTTINDIEASYDELMRSEQEFINEKYCIYKKSNSMDADE